MLIRFGMVWKWDSVLQTLLLSYPKFWCCWSATVCYWMPWKSWNHLGLEFTGGEPGCSPTRSMLLLTLDKIMHRWTWKPSLVRYWAVIGKLSFLYSLRHHNDTMCLSLGSMSPDGPLNLTYEQPKVWPQVLFGISAVAKRCNWRNLCNPTHHFRRQKLCACTLRRA